ncbi:DNA-binding protein/PTS system, IIA component [Treponema primitia ZAS-2]|uniref:DNA-binding protein/PTS system, IIA component n=1 Tax=Treponema primitia (strain ATCC BAA-887 / DSM 12427 / ZAS-2) TaxID=545694 RepID=F5YM11_TREPZ|nr:PTS sugar transporter subunit IIA [Treponema primitia]AEF83984.1 DNA-binding protein/PTS system, IIA component [Treponema primitia ZAS-2]
MIDDDILTIDEVAKYLRVSERTVYDWAQKGDIPAGKIGTVWRFKKSEIEKWVNDRLSTHTMTPLMEGIAAETFISPDRVLFLNFSTKREALIALANNLATAPQVKNPKELVQEILKREELMTTAMGRGIAIPHVRLASVTDMVISVGISRIDIVDFQPLDDEPVKLLFMIAAAHNQHAYYLQTIAFFSARLKNTGLRDALLGAENTQDAYALLVNRA